MAPAAEPADWPRGLRLAHPRQPVLLERRHLDLPEALLRQLSVAQEPVWPAALAVASAPVPRLLVVLVAAAVVRPAP